MKIIINGNADIVSADTGTTFGVLLPQLRVFLRDNKLMATAIVLDGEALSMGRETQLSGATVDAYSTLEVVAGDLFEYCRQALDAVSVATVKLEESARKCATTLTVSPDEIPRAEIEQTFDSMDFIQKGVAAVAGCLGITLVNLLSEGKPVTHLFARYTAALQEAKEALQNSDRVALSDVMEYELARSMGQWRRVLGELGAQIAEMEKNAQ